MFHSYLKVLGQIKKQVESKYRVFDLNSTPKNLFRLHVKSPSVSRYFSDISDVQYRKQIKSIQFISFFQFSYST